ncbi:MAG TPA: hypothetical protein HA322_06225, partial [Candidatus Poseidoniaceae archaeon]|nr:hypothetical protein [Candidatus Poseidoniaceae archaeon]
MLVFGVIWAGLCFGLFNVQWFAGEAFSAYEEMTTEEFYYEGTQEECQAAGLGTLAGCEIRNFNGGIWWSLLAALLFSIAFAPLASAFTIMAYRNKDVTDAWIGQVNGLLFAIPTAIIWAFLWLICLPFTWGLLPWGDWSFNWWKIFPFGFGLIWMGGLPLVITVINFFKKIGSPEYNHDLVSADKDRIMDMISGSNTKDYAKVKSNKSRLKVLRAEAARGGLDEAQQKELAGREKFAADNKGKGSAIFVAILAVIMMIPGIVLLIIGGVMAEGFIEGEGSSSYTLEIIDEDGLGDQGFIIFIQATPGDFNGNGMHDYCENVMVNANHSGAWMSDPWTGWSSYNEADETRQVFELEISHKSSGCDAQHWPKEKWVNEVQLVKIGRACYGCMAGNTTITAEYANEPTKPVGMWIQDGEKINESTALTIIGAILTGIGVLTLVGLAIIKIAKSKAAAQAVYHVEKDLIEIIESNPGQPVRFKLNDPPKGRDAWVGIYPASTGDQDHGDRWRWLRDIDVNNATLPGQSAGKWSIRVFKDGGYKLQHRLDFEISTSPQQLATPTSSKEKVAGNATITTSKSTYTIDEGINFSFTAPKLPDDAWIGIVPVAIPHGDEAVNDSHDISYAHLGGRTNGDITLPNPGLGTWTLRLHNTDNNGRELTHVVFEVVSSHGNAAQLHPADGRYELATDELSWNEHNDRALAMGGHLVSITSAEENELVARIAGGRTVWIGGMRKGSGNGPGAEHWCWCDGQPWIYANWAPGEPNNYGGNENRIHLYGQNKLWNDVGEGWRGPAVYQLPKEKS